MPPTLSSIFYYPWTHKTIHPLRGGDPIFLVTNILNIRTLNWFPVIILYKMLFALYMYSANLVLQHFPYFILLTRWCTGFSFVPLKCTSFMTRTSAQVSLQTHLPQFKNDAVAQPFYFKLNGQVLELAHQSTTVQIT